ncbi:MAG: response regulator [Bacteriovoracaceae bacterium]|nr:response regulator [Bacteriovoracaceae bacterium]
MTLKILADEGHQAQNQDEVPKRIIIIDDQEEILEILETFLSPESWEVHTALNGKEAMAMMKKLDFSIALVDIKMPGMTGLELIKKLNKNKINIKVILMTGDPSYETLKEGYEEHVSYYIEKPFVKSDVINKVDNIFCEILEEHEEQKKVSQLSDKVTFMRQVVRHLEESKKEKTNKIYRMILFFAIIITVVGLLWFSLAIIK